MVHPEAFLQVEGAVVRQVRQASFRVVVVVHLLCGLGVGDLVGDHVRRGRERRHVCSEDVQTYQGEDRVVELLVVRA